VKKPERDTKTRVPFSIRTTRQCRMLPEKLSNEVNDKHRDSAVDNDGEWEREMLVCGC
jgi:hypothetical protein